MHLTFRNVNEAFEKMVRGIYEKTIPTTASPSRYGDVLRIDGPIIITYTHPRERVLFNSARDCNPFFHLFESLWMLAGRNDVAPLVYYNSKMAEFSDNGEIFNGAYGHRWRLYEDWESEYAQQENQFAEYRTREGIHPLFKRGDYVSRDSDGCSYIDQLSWIIDCLKEQQTTRRVVLQMWDTRKDLMNQQSKDICCNTHIYFDIQNGKLVMTVCNRSNDLIWGTLGANVVHFSMLQEYIANCVGVPMGPYHQFSNNQHVYTERWFPEKWLNANGHYQTAEYAHSLEDQTINGGLLPPSLPLVKNKEVFDKEVKRFIDYDMISIEQWKEPFLAQIAYPMCKAFKHHKERDYDKALDSLYQMVHCDWVFDGIRWIAARKQAWESKNAGRTEENAANSN